MFQNPNEFPLQTSKLNKVRELYKYNQNFDVKQSLGHGTSITFKDKDAHLTYHLIDNDIYDPDILSMSYDDKLTYSYLHSIDLSIVGL